MSDWPALVIAYVYALATIGLAEFLRRWPGCSQEFTSQVVRIAGGMWAVGAVLLFHNRFMAIIPPLSFVILNCISYYRETLGPREVAEKASLSTVYFPISFAFIVLALWDHPGLVVASLMPMTWGGAMAAIMGRNYGQYHYQILGTDRTLEGSLSMFLFSLASIFLVLLISRLGLLPSLAYAFITAVVVTGVEAASPWGLDNLSVPVVAGALLYLLAG
jgi:phytol kinase